MATIHLILFHSIEYIFHELMPVKVKEVLLVANLYDSYSIVREGQFSDKIFGEYLQLNLYAAPRFTSANTHDEAIRLLDVREYDLVIVMAGVEKKMPMIIACPPPFPCWNRCRISF